jgi:ATP-dependent DNA helicase RecG
MVDEASVLHQKKCTALLGVGDKLAEKLAKLGLYTVSDLLFHLPLRYQDRTRLQKICHLQGGEWGQVEAVIQSVQLQKNPRLQLQCKVSDGSGVLMLRFFHFTAGQRNSFKIGARICCFAELRAGRFGLEMVHPQYRLLQAKEVVTLEETLTPIYPATEGVQQRTLTKLTDQALNYLRQGAVLSELLPASLREGLDLPPLHEALFYVHRPPVKAEQAILLAGEHPMQQRLVIEELLAHHLALRRLRTVFQKEKALALKTKNTLITTFISGLPFSLTDAQIRVGQEIKQDLEKPYPMLRLVQGDVGSGKTVVAAIVALQAVENQSQVVFMAPTELLAEQHYQNFLRWSDALGVSVVYLSGQLKAQERREALAAIMDGQANIIIGTHALFQKEVEFFNVALVIIDEQHRFGVHQRLSLREKGKQGEVCPHQLIMTATPIPRTLAMSAYADLAFSVIDELPPGRQAVKTVVLSNGRREEVIQKISAACREGRQVYWVCPLIEESEVLQCQAAEVCAEILREVLSTAHVSLLHGRMKSDEKEKVMQAFKEGKSDVLVATTVIEVGVDVPNASLMVIENAERMGLAQLHQLRGRVGRGSLQSHCVLLYQGPLSMQAKKRLGIIRETNDGFKVAEEDLALRGPGEVLGTKQTGVVQFRVADIVRDQGLLPRIKKMAKEVMQDYPDVVDPLIKRWVGEAVSYREV